MKAAPDARSNSLPEFVGLRCEDFSDSWRGLWNVLQVEFLPHAETIRPIRYSKRHEKRGRIASREYLPESPKKWNAASNDTKQSAKLRRELSCRDLSDYGLATDCYGWGLFATLTYLECRYSRNGWRGESNPEDSRILSACWTLPNRPYNTHACKFLVKMLEKFALARRHYLQQLELTVRKPPYTQVKDDRGIGDILGNHPGRPQGWKATKYFEENLWLTLIWPIAVRHCWSYKDVGRALRLRFNKDNHMRPRKSVTLGELSEQVSSIKSFRIRLSKEEQKHAEWQSKMLEVSRAEANQIRGRCNRFRLEKLNPLRRDIVRFPPFYSVAKQLYSNI